MTQKIHPNSFDSVLDEAQRAGHHEFVTPKDIIDKFGRSSFGPLLLLPSIILVSPVSAIPGLPTCTAVLIAFISVQMIIGRKAVWIPKRLGRIRMERKRLDKVVNFARPVSRVVDRVTKKRLTIFTMFPFDRVAALICLSVSLLMPPLELIPMANSTTGAAIALFGAGIMTKDGTLSLIGFLVTFLAIYLALTNIIS